MIMATIRLTMATIRLTNKTTNTIIIVALLSLVVLHAWVSSLFSKKYGIKNEINGMGS